MLRSSDCVAGGGSASAPVPAVAADTAGAYQQMLVQAQVERAQYLTFVPSLVRKINSIQENKTNKFILKEFIFLVCFCYQTLCTTTNLYTVQSAIVYSFID